MKLLDGFNPQQGDRFHLFVGSISGQFSNMLLPSLGDGLSWDTNGSLSVVPEPTTGILLLAGGITLLLRRARHREKMAQSNDHDVASV